MGIRKGLSSIHDILIKLEDSGLNIDLNLMRFIVCLSPMQIKIIKIRYTYLSCFRFLYVSSDPKYDCLFRRLQSCYLHSLKFCMTNGV